jgi:serine/threonine-protein kinase RsbW
MASPERNGTRIQLTLPSRLELLGVVDKIADGITEFLEFEDVDRDAVAISVIEACTNAIQHGHGQEAGKPVRIEFLLEPAQLTVRVHDQGRGFEPVPEGDMSPPDLLATRGRGIFIMRSMMDEVNFDFSDGTWVELVKRKSRGAAVGGGEAGAGP